MVKGQVGLLIEIDCDSKQISKGQVKKRSFFGEILWFFENTYAFKTVHGDGNVLLSLQVQSLHEHCSKETGEDSANPRAFYAAPKLTNFSKKKKKYGAYFYGVFFIYFQRKLLASSSARCSIVPGDQEWESANFHPCIEPSKAKNIL